MATEGIKYLYHSFLLLIKEDHRYIDDNKLLNSYINIKDDNNFYLMKIAQMLKKFPDIMVKIDPLIYKAYSDDLYFHIIKNHPYFTAAAGAIPNTYNAAAAVPAAALPVITATANVPVIFNAANVAVAAPAAPVATATNLIAVAAVNAANAAELAIANFTAAVPVAVPAAAAAPGATNLKIKLFCDLILFDILCRMNFNKFDSDICESNKIIKKFLTHITNPNSDVTYTDNINIFDNDGNVKNKSRKDFLKDNKRGIEKMNDYIGNFTIPMDKKIILYKILNFLINDDFIGNSTEAQIIKVMFELITHETNGCAPRTILEELSIKGGNKSGKYEYFLCKCNFKESLKKVVAKSAREAAKILAKKVLKGNKKSIKFSLKRMIGKKEKCYDYDVSIDKSGKIIIKNQ